jgi:hypothetical protein
MNFSELNKEYRFEWDPNSCDDKYFDSIMKLMEKVDIEEFNQIGSSQCKEYLYKKDKFFSSSNKQILLGNFDDIYGCKFDKKYYFAEPIRPYSVFKDDVGVYNILNHSQQIIGSDIDSIFPFRVILSKTNLIPKHFTRSSTQKDEYYWDTYNDIQAISDKNLDLLDFREPYYQDISVKIVSRELCILHKLGFRFYVTNDRNDSIKPFILCSPYNLKTIDSFGLDYGYHNLIELTKNRKSFSKISKRSVKKRSKRFSKKKKKKKRGKLNFGSSRLITSNILKNLPKNFENRLKDRLFYLYETAYGQGKTWFTRDLIFENYLCGYIFSDTNINNVKDIDNIESFFMFQKTPVANKISLIGHDGSFKNKSNIMNIVQKLLNEPGWIGEASGKVWNIFKKSNINMIQNKNVLSLLNISRNEKISYDDPNGYIYAHEYYSDDDKFLYENIGTLFGTEGCLFSDSNSCNRSCEKSIFLSAL